MQQTSTNITKVGRVIIPVSDQDKALEFYAGTLGFEVVADMPFGEGDRWLEVAPPGSEARIALQPPPGGLSAEKGQSCVCFSTSDLDADHAALKDRGVDVDEPMGGRRRPEDVLLPRPGREQPAGGLRLA